MKYSNQNVGIAYFTNPAAEIEGVGKTIDGIMTSVAREVPVRKVNTDYESTIVEKMKPTVTPSLIFTNDAGDLEHIRIEGNKLAGATVQEILKVVGDIIEWNKSNPNG
jgi:hypothetical protein